MEALTHWATHQFINGSFNKDEIVTYFKKLLEFCTENLNIMVSEVQSLLNSSKFWWKFKVPLNSIKMINTSFLKRIN